MFGRTWIRYLDTNYEVSHLGEVRHIKTKYELTPAMHYKGELRVNIHGKQKRVHVMVCTCFKKKKPGCTIVNHIDGNKQNCHYTNVEWTTVSGNTKHAVQMGFIDMDRVRSCRKINTRVRI